MAFNVKKKMNKFLILTKLPFSSSKIANSSVKDLNESLVLQWSIKGEPYKFDFIAQRRDCASEHSFDCRTTKFRAKYEYIVPVYT